MVRRHREFTVLVVLTAIGERSVVPLASTWMHIVGDEVDWAGIVDLLAGSGREWDGATFFPTRADGGGPVDAATARRRPAELEAKVAADRMVLNDGQFFDTLGHHIEIEPIADS
jgi:hypothetical protein